mgnify:CR=1 FL=1
MNSWKSFALVAILLKDCFNVSGEIKGRTSLFDFSPLKNSTEVSYDNQSNEVWLYTVYGGGHTWPGAWGNMDISASEEIWSFFKKYLR